MCSSYGFQPSTEPHATCVMNVVQTEQGRQATRHQSTTSAVLGVVGTIFGAVITGLFLLL
jgi:hypothetical protein